MRNFVVCALVTFSSCSAAQAQWIEDHSQDQQRAYVPYQDSQDLGPPQPLQPRSPAEWFDIYDKLRKKTEISPDAENHLFALISQPGPLTNPDDQQFVEDVLNRWRTAWGGMQKFLPISATEKLHNSYTQIIQEKGTLVREMLKAQSDPALAAAMGGDPGEIVRMRRNRIGQLEHSFGSLEQTMRGYYQVPPPVQSAPEEQQQ